MKNSARLLVLLFIVFSFSAFAQNMEEGFRFLEKGEFAKAELFFETVIKDYPDNKTANLCYARAVGLNGNPQKANTIFSTMLKTFPGDFELQLNYAESLLWLHDYINAKSYYTGLIEAQPQSFPALLGYANTLSNLKEYAPALEYVNKALTELPGNPNALVSRKYIRLGYAAQLVQQRDYAGAEQLLNDALADFPGDKDVLLNKANLYLITKDRDNAMAAYAAIATTPADSVVALNGYALAEHIATNDKKALKWAQEAVKKANALQDENLIKQATERYIQALVWNKKYTLAEEAIAVEKEKYPNENRVLALSATLGMYRSDFKESIADYKNILANDSLSFDGNLGIANAYYADGDPDNAYSAVNKTLQIFENQKDAKTFLQKLHTAYSPYVEEKVGYSYDNGKNKAYFSATTLYFPLSTKWAVSGFYQYRETKNTVTENRAETNDFKLGAEYQFHPKISINAFLGTTSVSSYSNSYSQALVQVFFKAKPFKLQDLEAGYKRDVQNFNADLVNSEITADNLYVNYNMGTNFNLGWFTQYFYTSQSDSNTRNLLFTSLYYSFFTQPVLKGGINYQYISFKERKPEVYFSPKRFNLVEVFAEFMQDEQAIEKKNVFYGLNAALGYQFIESNDKQGTYRVQARFGYKFSDRFIANVYALNSNIASATAAGFNYTEMGFRLKWYLTSRPVFVKQ
jgi:tetratricopeptide (TPR) repeat protein